MEILTSTPMTQPYVIWKQNQRPPPSASPAIVLSFCLQTMFQSHAVVAYP